MLTFRMDETNFADGARQGVRIATGAGLKVDFDEFAADGNTLGLWHLHNGACQGEGTGLLDASGGGHSLTNHGAAAVEDGYQFAATEGDYMRAAFSGQSARETVTLECWVQGWNVPDGTSRAIVTLGWNSASFIYLLAKSGPSAFITCRTRTNGEWPPADVAWNTPVDEINAILKGTKPWHCAMVLDVPANRWCLYVNGVERGSIAPHGPLVAGNYTLGIGEDPWTTTGLEATVDEVRLSATVRYASTFTPHRLLAEGVTTSPTFDATRLGAEWLDLARAETIPEGCGTDWDVRAADETDAAGDPQTVWEPYGGEPSALPDGRYFQWRVALSSPGDRLASPAIGSVEAKASESGYNLYHATGDGPVSLDYISPFVRVGPGLTQVATEALDAGAVHWFAVRPVSALGTETPLAQDEVRLETAAQGQRVPDRPAGVLAAGARPLPLGAVQLQWQYRTGIGGVLPQTFRIFGDGGTGTIDYQSPLGQVDYQQGRTWYGWASGPLAGSGEHQLAVRAVTAGGVWDEQPAVVRVTPDATPPDHVDALQAETMP